VVLGEGSVGVYAVSNLNQLKGVQTKRIESPVSEKLKRMLHMCSLILVLSLKDFPLLPSVVFVCCILWIFAALAGIENYPAEGASWSQLSFDKRFLLQILSQGGIPRSGKVVTLVRRQER